MADEIQDPQAFKDTYYNNSYEKIHYRGWLGKFTGTYHTKLEDPKKQILNADILEIGGGTGEHLPYVSKSFKSYTLTDIQIRKSEIVEKLLKDEWYRDRINLVECNAEDLPFQDDSFNRVICTCLLHHLAAPDSALREWRRVSRNGGLISIYLPCDPGLLYRYIRHLFSHRKQVSVSGNSMQKIMYLWAIEHRNHFLGLYYLINEIFSNDQIIIRRFPFPYLSWNFNLFAIIQITVIKDA